MQSDIQFTEQQVFFFFELENIFISSNTNINFNRKRKRKKNNKRLTEDQSITILARSR